MNIAALLQKLHGVLGVLALAALLHPAITLRADKRPSPRIVLSCQLAWLLTLVSVVAGWGAYLEYRQTVKPWLLDNHASLHTLWFEIKEAVGWFTLVAATAGAALVHWSPEQPVARAAAGTLFLIASFSALAAGTIGVIVASYRDLGASLGL